jgi:transglutaminase/protease-like cytokinesis protein 3
MRYNVDAIAIDEINIKQFHRHNRSSYPTNEIRKQNKWWQRHIASKTCATTDGKCSEVELL